MNEVQKIFRDIKDSEGISYGEIADKLGLTAPHFSMILKGSTPINRHHVAKMMDVFGFDENELAVIQRHAWLSRKSVELPIFMTDDVKCLIWCLTENWDKLSAAQVTTLGTVLQDLIDEDDD